MEEEGNVEIVRILDILRGKKLMIVIIMLLFILFGCLYSFKYVVPKYQSSTTLLLIPQSAKITNSDLTLNSGLISTYSNIVDNPKVLNQVIDNLGLNMTTEQLAKNIDVKVMEQTYIIQITVTDLEPQRTMNIAREVTNVFLNEIKELYSLNNIGVIDEAQLPQSPYNINHKKDIAMSVALGMFVSLAIAVLIYIFDNTVKEEKDIEKYIKIKSLGSIPINKSKGEEIVNKNGAKSYVTECINTIRTNILYMNSTKNAKTISVTSCTPREGKSWASANIAVSFAETNKKVLLIDADMRKGRLNKIFNLDSAQGLSNYLYSMTGDVAQDAKLGNEYIKETKIPNLHILTNGTIPPNPSELIDSDNMKNLLEILKNAYDIIIVDTPPCKLVTDSIVLSTIVDSTVLVVNAEKTKIRDLQEVCKMIQNVGGEIIGAVLNQTKVKGRIYSKSYYYGHSNESTSVKKQTDKGVSVSDVLEFARTKTYLQPETPIDLKEETQEKEHQTIDKAEEEQQLNDNSQQIKKLTEEQNRYFEKVADVISGINSKINSIKIVDYTDDINKIHDEIGKIEVKDYENQIEQIHKQIEDIKQVDDIKIMRQEIEQVHKQIEDMKQIDDVKIMRQEIEQVHKQIEEMKQIDDVKIMRQEIEQLHEQIEGINTVKQEIEATINDKNEELLDTVKEHIESIENKDNTEEIEKLQEQISNIKIVDYTDDINKIHDEIGKIEVKDYENQIEQIHKQIEDIKQVDDIKIMRQEIEQVHKQIEDMKQIDDVKIMRQEIEQVHKQIEEMKQIDDIKIMKQEIEQVHEQIEGINTVKQEIEATINDKNEELLDTVKEHIESIETKDNTEEIEKLQEQISNIKIVDYTDDINKIHDEIGKIEVKDYENQIEQIYKQIEDLKSYTSKKMIEIINNNNTLLKNTINKNHKGILKEVKENIDNIEKVDYTQQIEEINYRIEELSKEIQNSIQDIKPIDYTNTIEEIKQKVAKNIIDIKELQAKKENKMTFDIDEDIPYDELEKTAMYIIPISNNQNEEETKIAVEN